VFRYPGNSSCPRDLAGRGSFPLCTRASLARELRARRRSWGSPFAGLIPLTGGHAAQARRLNRTFSNISVRPGPRAVRIPLSPCAAGAPRFIFVGPSGRLALVNRKTRKRDGRSGGYLRGVRLLGFDSRLRSGGGQRDRQIHRSCLGLASCRVVGHLSVHRQRARPRRRSPASGDPTPPPHQVRGGHALSNPLMGLRRFLPDRNTRMVREI
jgi:hypothetical protein